MAVAVSVTRSMRAATGRSGGRSTRGGLSTRGQMAAAAFDPSKSEIGITDPIGFWDPLSLSMRDKDEARFRRYQEAEIKHGRVSMLAATGILASTAWRLPGFEAE